MVFTSPQTLQWALKYDLGVCTKQAKQGSPNTDKLGNSLSLLVNSLEHFPASTPADFACDAYVVFDLSALQSMTPCGICASAFSLPRYTDGKTGTPRRLCNPLLSNRSRRACNRQKHAWRSPGTTVAAEGRLLLWQPSLPLHSERHRCLRSATHLATR